jgi:hypothetical protein
VKNGVGVAPVHTHAEECIAVSRISGFVAVGLSKRSTRSLYEDVLKPMLSAAVPPLETRFWTQGLTTLCRDHVFPCRTAPTASAS